MKKIIMIAIIIGVILGMKTFVFKSFHNKSLFKHYSHFLADSGAWTKHMFNIAKFEMPENYKLLRWMEGFRQGPKYTAIGIFGEEKKPDDILILYKIPLHKKIDPSKVEVIEEESKDTHFGFAQRVFDTMIQPEQKFFYTMARYDIPFFWKFQDNPENRTLILRGLEQTDYKEIETDKIKAYIRYGKFREVFFDKKPDSFFKYWITSLYFQQDRHGAIALIQDRKTGATFFAIQSAILSIPIDREKFEKFIKSIDFNTEVYDPDHNLQERKEELAKKGIKLSTFTVTE